MNLFFDEDSQKLINNAKKEMFNLKHPYVGSEHLLLAILNDKSLSITNVLNNCGLTYDLFYTRLVEIVGIGSKSNNWFLFTPLLKRIINNAIYYSKDNNSFVTPRSLLVCLLQEGDGVANRILISLNLDLELLCDKFTINTNDFLMGKKLFLDDYATNMNELVLLNNIEPIICRDDEVNKLIQILMRKNKNNPLLIGEAGVGKTAIVEELARRITIGEVPYRLKNSIIYNLPIYNIVSDTKYRGEFESRVKKIISEISTNPNIILFIDEIHTIVGAGGAEGAIDASNIIKPYLARGELKIIGATTINEYSKYISNDRALSRRFQNVFIEETNYSKTKEILLSVRSSFEKYHNVDISDEIINACLDYSNKFFLDGKQPDKSIDLLDELCSYTILKNNTYKKLINFDKALYKISNNKNNEILNHNFKKALYYRSREKKILSDYNNYRLCLSNSYVIYKDYIDDLIYDKTGIPIGLYFKKLFHDLNKKLKKYLYAQDNVVDTFYNYLIKSNYINKNRILSFLFVGKSGCGKTFLVDKLHELIFDNDSFYRINMCNYKDEYLFSNLINNDSYFYKIKQRPFSLIFFDDIDCCCLSVRKRIFQIVSNGFINTVSGQHIDLSKCIIILSSNSKKDSVGFNNYCNNDYFISDNCFRIVFNDITKNDVVNYILKKYHDYNISDEHLKQILSCCKYEDYGFRYVDENVENIICLC